MKRISNDTKVKMLQASVYIGAIATLIFAFDWMLLGIGLVLGWFLWLFGVSMCLHKWASHRAFTPKNKLIKHFLLYMGTMSCLGSTICWAAGHREHHRTADHKNDPHNPAGGLWHKVKTWFYYFPAYYVTPMIVKDLMNDSDHKKYHNNYYKIVIASVCLLFLIDPVLVGYLFCIPVFYTLTGISWVTVYAHIPETGYLSYRTFDSDDYTYNSHFWSLMFAGEGYHNTHHSKAGLWNNAIRKGEFDISAQFIKLMGIPNKVKVKDVPVPRTGKALRDELRAVTARIEKNNENL